MSLHLGKKSIIKKTFQVGALTFLSRMVAIFREILQARFLGVGIISDAFIMAFRIPNLFRHVFAEGALNASFVPILVKTVKEGRRNDANGLISISMLTFQGVIFLLYLFVVLKTEFVVKILAPGFSAEQAAHTITFLRIFFPYLFLVSGSALLAGSLNAVNHFFIPAFGQALWNMIYVISIIICFTLKLSPLYLCWGALIAGMAQFGMYLITYFKHKFTFGPINKTVVNLFKQVMTRFFPCLFGVSIIEINLLVSGIVASYLPEGSISLLYYGSRFMNLPLGVFAVAFASILLPHFSRIVLYAPKRMSFYILEVTKFVSWVIIPASLFLMFVSEKLFSTLILAKKGTPEQIMQAKWILIIYSIGLLFFCLNKVLLNVFYSLKDTVSTTIISIVGAIVNLFCDITGMLMFGIYGIAAASTISGIAMTLLCFYFLRKKHKFRFYGGNYALFLIRFIPQLLLIGSVCTLSYYAVSSWLSFFTSTIGFWLCALTLGAAVFVTLFATKKLFRTNVYFLR